MSHETTPPVTGLVDEVLAELKVVAYMEEYAIAELSREGVKYRYAYARSSGHDAALVRLSGAQALIARQAAPVAVPDGWTWRVKLDGNYGADLLGHWFYLQPADEYAAEALRKHTGQALPNEAVVIPPTPPAQQSQAAIDVLAERRRQIESEDFDYSHDDMATSGQLAGAAACYAINGVEHLARDQAIKTFWPWDESWWKPSIRRRDLIKAGALIIAEIERLDRAAGDTAAPEQPSLGCDYHGSHFGASYPDAQCTDGYLWDEDSCDEPGGPLRAGGDIPCPKCNAAEYAQYLRDVADGEERAPEQAEPDAVTVPRGLLECYLNGGGDWVEAGHKLRDLLGGGA